MHWDDLKHVLAIGRASTLSGAGTLLGVTHTTVSRRLATRGWRPMHRELA